MAYQLFVDLGDGQVTVMRTRPGEHPHPGTPAELARPLDASALEDLRWYLEDYLLAPYAVYEERGQDVEAALRGWGQAMFTSVFGKGPARDAYIRAREQGGTEIVFRSADPALLGLPWELMADPARPTPLALDVAAVGRSLPMSAASPEMIPVPDGRLRVLMVISRPHGTGDVPYQMIARPLLEALGEVRGQVDLVVLRPPTLGALKKELKRAAGAGRPYQVVHFDGHGALARPENPDVRVPLAFDGTRAEAVLAFEADGGGPEHISASVIAGVLHEAGIPVVVLNACQSGAVAADAGAAIATRLLQEGVASVVAMAYSVWAVAAAEFMAAFYEELFAGRTVSAAVTAGRRQLTSQPRRPSAKGPLPLEDWMVPVHYLRGDVSFPQAVVERPSATPSLEEALARLGDRERQGGAGDLAPAGGKFVGRDALFYQLEEAARLKKVVVLSGLGGTGKTELAKAFGRWWLDTGGVDSPEEGQPDWVFWHSFEPGRATFGLDAVISEIGLRRWGAGFARHEAALRRALVLDFLTTRRTLLIWDNFESVHSMPDPGRATAPLDEAGRAELRDFLGQLAARGKGAVLITSRTREEWLGDAARLRVGGLARHEAVAYADHLLAPYPAAGARRQGRPFADLMAWLDGNPLALRVILLRLAVEDPQAILAGLSDGMAGTGDGGERTGSLEACIRYSYAHLSEPVRRALPVISLFHGVVNPLVLDMASGLPERFAGADWMECVKGALRFGLLDVGGAKYPVFRIHPALPGYLAKLWQAEDGVGYQAAREQATRSLATSYGDLGRWLIGEIADGERSNAFSAIGADRRNLEVFLRHALDRELWLEAGIYPAMTRYWASCGLDAEEDTWRDRVLAATEGSDGAAPPTDSEAWPLWEAAAVFYANMRKIHGQRARAESAFRRVVAGLEPHGSSPGRDRLLAEACQSLEELAAARGNPEEAARWRDQARAVREETEASGQPGPVTPEERGNAAREAGDLVAAERWYRESLASHQGAGDRGKMAADYVSLQDVLLGAGRIAEATDLVRRELAFREELGDDVQLLYARAKLAYFLAIDDGAPLKEAEDHARSALDLADVINASPAKALLYGALEQIARRRGRLGDADAWHQHALALQDEAGDRGGSGT